MKLVYFILLFFISQSLQAQSSCVAPANSLSKQISNLNDVKCADVNKNYVCKETQVDSSSLRANMQKTLDHTMNPQTIENYRKNWVSQMASFPQMAKYFAPRDDFDILNKTAPVPLVNWLNQQAFATSEISDDMMKEGFLDKYVAFSRKMGCRAEFKLKNTHVEHPTIKPFSTKNKSREEIQYAINKMKQDVNNPQAVSGVAEYIKKINRKALDMNTADRSLNHIMVCSAKPIPLRSTTQIRLIHRPCGGNFKKYFADNVSQVGPIEMGKIMSSPEAQEVSSCIKERLAQGAKIQFIDISSSASTLSNTGAAAQKFCKKGFLGLSEDRSKSARQQILPKLFDQAGLKNFDIAQVPVKMNSAGSNGDGTSGPCAHADNGRGAVKSEYLSGASRKELDNYKYVNIQVTFQDDGKELNNTVYVPEYPCREVEFFCPKTKQ